MTKKIDTKLLVEQIANNLESGFDIPKQNISKHIGSLLDGVLTTGTISKNLPDKYKHINKTTPCDICQKRISNQNGRMKIHKRLQHGVTD